MLIEMSCLRKWAYSVNAARCRPARGTRFLAIGRFGLVGERSCAILHFRMRCPGDGTADMSVSKTDAERRVGSNPTPGTISFPHAFWRTHGELGAAAFCSIHPCLSKLSFAYPSTLSRFSSQLRTPQKPSLALLDTRARRIYPGP